MEKTVQQAYDEFVSLLCELLLSNCPVDTGNMKDHIFIENNGQSCKITIKTLPYTLRQTSTKQVEYASNTEGQWTNGKSNPNEGWIKNDSIRVAAYVVADHVTFRK